MLNRISVLSKEYSLNYLGLFFWFLWRQTIFLINSRKERELHQRAVWWLDGLGCLMSSAQLADGTPEDEHDGGMPSGDALEEGHPNSDRACQGKGKGVTRYVRLLLRHVALCNASVHGQNCQELLHMTCMQHVLDIGST